MSGRATDEPRQIIRAGVQFIEATKNGTPWHVRLSAVTAYREERRSGSQSGARREASSSGLRPGNPYGTITIRIGSGDTSNTTDTYVIETMSEGQHNQIIETLNRPEYEFVEDE